MARPSSDVDEQPSPVTATGSQMPQYTRDDLRSILADALTMALAANQQPYQPAIYQQPLPTQQSLLPQLTGEENYAEWAESL